MNVLVVGAGFTGCTLTYLLNKNGHQVAIKEKLDHIGGLCFTTKSPNGILYEPSGAHTFHTNNDTVIEFIQKFSKFNSYVHNKGIILNRNLRHYPLSIETIKKMPESDQILEELKDRPKNVDRTNYETSLISIFGPTLYKLFI